MSFILQLNITDILNQAWTMGYKAPAPLFSDSLQSAHISLIPGLGPPSGHVSRQAPDPEVQAQHADQQGAHAQVRRREPLQVSFPVKYPEIYVSAVSFEPFNVRIQWARNMLMASP